MKIQQIYISLLVSIILIANGCASGPRDITLKIPSFREHYPILLKEAQKWHSDAYLNEARIFLFPTNYDPDVISASFYSPSEDLKSLGVYLHQDGTITSEVFGQEYSIYHHKPITETDWKIDSQEAMEYMLDEAGQRSVNSDRNACSFIILERILPVQDQPVIWSLSLWDCSDSVQHLYLDANSSEILDSSAVNIKPTRFPTSLP